MRATGVIRRIDDLGRIVIPKEIRRSLRMREGDPLEIFTDRGGEVILKKYSIMAGLTSLAKDCATSVYKSAGVRCAVCDGEKITAFGGERETLSDDNKTLLQFAASLLVKNIE